MIDRPAGACRCRHPVWRQAGLLDHYTAADGASFSSGGLYSIRTAGQLPISYRRGLYAEFSRLNKGEKYNEPSRRFSGAGFIKVKVRRPNFEHTYEEYAQTTSDQIVPHLQRATVAIINKVRVERRDSRGIAQAENDSDCRNRI